MRPILPMLAAALLWALSTTTAHAAGGHHAVDDATILDTGRCHVETWHEREAAGTLLQIGPACRLGAIEWTLGWERAHDRDAGGSARALIPQAKWATRTAYPPLSLGVAAGVALERGGERVGGGYVLLPATLELGESTLLHANLGRGRTRGERDVTLWGGAVEQALGGPWSAVLERYRVDAARPQWQAGLRLMPLADRLTFDLSYAHAPRRVTAGVTVEFGR